MIEIGSGQIKTVTFSLCLFLEIPSGTVCVCVRLCMCGRVCGRVCAFSSPPNECGLVLCTPSSLCRDRFWCNDSDVDGRRELFERIFATLEAAG